MIDHSNQSQATLVGTAGGAHSGGSSDFQLLYADWFDVVTRWVRLLGAPAAYREDLTQDVFVIVHRRLPEFDGDNVAGWLYRITRHRVRDFRRGSWFRKQSANVPLEASHCRELGAGPCESLETKRAWLLLEGLLHELNDSERTALLLFTVEGSSGEEIAALQGVSLNTVFSRVRRGRCKLQSSLAGLSARERRVLQNCSTQARRHDTSPAARI